MRLKLMCIFLVLCHPLIAQNSVSYSFFVAGHASGTPGVNNPGLHPPFKKHFPYLNNYPNLQLGILTGDIVRAFPFPTEKDWEEVDNDISKLNIPVYYAVGNHDMENREVFEDRYGSTYFHFLYENDLFIIIDPNLDNWNISESQLSYVKTVLDTTRASNIYVFCHQVLWVEYGNDFDYIKWNSDEGRASEINFWGELIPLFVKINKPVYFFAGDVGAAPYASQLSYDKAGKFTFISSGMGNLTNENYLIVNVDADKSLKYNVICTSDSNDNCLGDIENHIRNDFATIQHTTPFDGNLKCFPNPSNTIAYIKLPFSISGTISVFNPSGKLQDSFPTDSRGITEIPVFNYSPGIYLIQITSQYQNFHAKLLVY